VKLYGEVELQGDGAIAMPMMMERIIIVFVIAIFIINIIHWASLGKIKFGEDERIFYRNLLLDGRHQWSSVCGVLIIWECMRDYSPLISLSMLVPIFIVPNY
jgi:hypothetical protein